MRRLVRLRRYQGGHLENPDLLVDCKSHRLTKKVLVCKNLWIIAEITFEVNLDFYKLSDFNFICITDYVLKH